MSDARVLVAGIGNVFFGDDGFGVEVAAQLVQRDWPAQVHVKDFGIRGYDLAYALLDDYEVVILIDAAPRGGQPGTLYLVEPDCDDTLQSSLDAHTMNPVKVLQFAQALGGSLPRVLLVGCEPEPMRDGEDMSMGLSRPVQAAVGEAVEMTESLVARILAGEPLTAGEAAGGRSGGK